MALRGSRSSRSRRAEGSVDLDPLFKGKDVVALARRTFEGIGLEVEGILERSDLFPRPGKYQHAFCIDVDRSGDVRILANVIDNHSWTDTMLHELGHGVYDLGFDEGLPWLLRDTHLVTTEASALLFGALGGDREWLERILGVDARRGGRARSRLRAARAAELLVFTRWVLVMTGLRADALRRPRRPTWTRVWWELVSRHQLLTPPDGRQAPDWAAKIHIAAAPVYYHTYLYGVDRRAPAPRTRSDARVGGIVDRPEAGDVLVEKLFAPGAVDPLGPARRAGLGHAALGRVARPRGRGRWLAGRLRLRERPRTEPSGTRRPRRVAGSWQRGSYTRVEQRGPVRARAPGRRSA